MGRQVQVNYREVFFAHNGMPPHRCFFCEEDVNEDDIHIHHVDHNSQNHAPANLVPCHHPCHRRHHQTGSKRTVASRELMSRSAKKRFTRPGERKKASQAARSFWDDPNRVGGGRPKGSKDSRPRRPRPKRTCVMCARAIDVANIDRHEAVCKKEGKGE